MRNKRFIEGKNMIAIVLFLCTTILIAGCQKGEANSQEADEVVIHPTSYVSESGILYDDQKNFAYKCYYDFESMTNMYFCSRPNCDHSSIDCTSRLSHPFTFFIGNDQYYIEKKFEMDTSEQKIVSYLYKSDISNTETKVVATLDGETLNDIYLANNKLNILLSKPKFVDGITNSNQRWDIYQIDMKDYSVKKILLNEEEGYDGYILSGFIDNKMILYHRYYDKIVDPADYGLKGNMGDFIKDTENYRKYMEEVMKKFHEEMLYVDLDKSDMVPLYLPTPLLIHNEFYYYNKETTEGSHQLVSHNFITKEETTIYEGPVKTLSIVGDTLFLTEGIEKISDITFQPTIGFKENAREYSYNLISGERREVLNHLPEEAVIDLITEYGDYYIFFYDNYKEAINKRVGYIRKEDYYKGKDKYTLVTPI